MTNALGASAASTLRETASATAYVPDGIGDPHRAYVMHLLCVRVMQRTSAVGSARDFRILWAQA